MAGTCVLPSRLIPSNAIATRPRTSKWGVFHSNETLAARIRPLELCFELHCCRNCIAGISVCAVTFQYCTSYLWWELSCREDLIADKFCGISAASVFMQSPQAVSECCSSPLRVTSWLISCAVSWHSFSTADPLIVLLVCARCSVCVCVLQCCRLQWCSISSAHQYYCVQQ